MKEVGTVIKADKKNIKVRLVRKTACANCGMCGFKQDDMHVDITTENTFGANVGDEVELSMETSTVMFSASIVYLLPLVFALLGYLVSLFVGKSDLIQFAGLIVGVAVGFLAVMIVDKKVKKTKFNPVCTGIVQAK